MIFKFQQGGAMPPLVSYTPVIIQDRRTLGDGETTTTSSTTDKGEITQKDTLKMIQEMLNGLPSDQAVAMKQLTPLFQAPLSKWEPTSSQNIATKYLKALSTLSNLKFNKEQYDKALDIAKGKDSLNEAAITANGYVYCVNIKDKNDYKLLSPEQIKKQDTYTPITNQDLLWLRANNPSLAFQNDLFNTINSSSSMKEIVATIKAITANLGSSQQDTTLYATVPSGTVVDSLNTIKQLLQNQPDKVDLTLQDLYKHNDKSSTQLQQAQHALNWLYRQLSDSQRALIKLKTPEGTEEQVKQLMYEAIAASMSDSITTDWTLVGGPSFKTESKQANAGTKDNTDMKASFLTNLLTSQGASQTTPITIDRGDGTQLNVNGAFYNLVPNEKSQEPITNTSMADMLAKSGIQRLATNLHAITFGDQKVSMQQLNNIAYLNAGIVRANLPKNEDGTVKLQVLEDFNQAMNEIKLLGDNASKEQVSAIINKYRLNSYILPNGAANPQTCGTFLITEGYTNEDIINTNNSKFIKNKNFTDDEEELINSAINSTKQKGDKKFDIGGYFTDTYKAAIYIPITNNLNTALQNSGLDQDEADTLEQKYQRFNKMNQAKSTSADIL